MFVQCPSGGPEGDRTLEPHGCEPCALPAELQAQIGTFYAEKVAEFGFLKYALFRKNQRIGLKNGATNLGRMWLAMDANAALSQLSYEPKSALFVRKKLRILDFSNIQFSGGSPTNRTGKRGTENRIGYVSLWMRTERSPS